MKDEQLRPVHFHPFEPHLTSTRKIMGENLNALPKTYIIFNWVVCVKRQAVLRSKMKLATKCSLISHTEITVLELKVICDTN